MNELESSLRLLKGIDSPEDLKALSPAECVELASEMRSFIVEAVTRNSGHLGSNLGAVEVTIALHRVFSSPRDVLLFDTGHQSYVHKLITGRRDDFPTLRQQGGLSGYPSRAESEHDWIENSHASTALSYAYGVAAAFKASGEEATRRVVALVGDGALTGGMAYEALNNLGHAGSRVTIVLNDNGRSYAPTISKLSGSLTQLRLNPSYLQVRERLGHVIHDLPGLGPLAYSSVRNLTSALRELVEPHVFFEALGIRYTGPIDGHDIAGIELALSRAATWPGPIVLHVLTRKGKGYGPAEADDIQCLHDLKAERPLGSPGTGRDQGALKVGPRSPEASYTEAFSAALLSVARRDERVMAITAAMPGPTGLLPFEARYPQRFIDVGIAEAHAMTAAAGMALCGLRPVVAIYSTFLGRAFDQENLDVGLHKAPVVICADRAGITGDDGASHHGLVDMVLSLAIPGVTIFAPAEPSEIGNMLESALKLDSPSLIRYPKTPGRSLPHPSGEGLASRLLRAGAGEVVLIGVGKMAGEALDAAEQLAQAGIEASVFDPRLVRPVDEQMIEAALRCRLVVTIEDGLVHGGAGNFIRQAIEELALSHGAKLPRVCCLGVPTIHIAHGKPAAILAELGLDGAGIASSTTKALASIEGTGASELRGRRKSLRAAPSSGH